MRFYSQGHQRTGYLRSIFTVVITAIVFWRHNNAYAQSIEERDPRRPPWLTNSPECEVWRGSAPGNDPTTEFELRTCERNGRVTCDVQISGIRAGWTHHLCEGHWNASLQLFALRDLRFLAYHPNPGWEGCLVDTYELHRQSHDQLDGTFVSTTCEDRGEVHLRLHQTVVQSPTPPPVVAIAHPPPLYPRGSLSTRSRGNCLCFAKSGGSATDPTSSVIVVFGLVVLAIVQRRHN